ncbi:MAG: hypothetical protein NTW86_25580 [Candidatus Sumerlaeota bacterium]|nr:hypothetical protein [Candidatus Sumerlaeota bacterium]
MRHTKWLPLSGTCIAFALTLFFSAPRPLYADDENAVDISSFYNALAPYGTWFDDPTYGWCWTPTDVAPDWRPYTVGHWEYVDDYGWTWDSDEAWGWATDHYGRWMFNSDLARWVWIPGTEWSPAWVDFRAGDGWIGWAPVAPGVVLTNGRYAYDDFDWDDWRFVPQTAFCEPNLDDYICEPEQNLIHLRGCNDITFFDFDRDHHRFINRSLSANEVEEFAHHRVRRLGLADAGRPGYGRVTADTLQLFHPRITGAKSNIVPSRFLESTGRNGAGSTALGDSAGMPKSKLHSPLQSQAPGNLTQIGRVHIAPKTGLTSNVRGATELNTHALNHAITTQPRFGQSPLTIQGNHTGYGANANFNGNGVRPILAPPTNSQLLSHNSPPPTQLRHFPSMQGQNATPNGATATRHGVSGASFFPFSGNGTSSPILNSALGSSSSVIRGGPTFQPSYATSHVPSAPVWRGNVISPPTAFRGNFSAPLATRSFTPSVSHSYTPMTVHNYAPMATRGFMPSVSHNYAPTVSHSAPMAARSFAPSGGGAVWRGGSVGRGRR